ncbi:hypothetical protein N7G274_008404 [Stereocaulon virgatum]|uniref:VWFA domain-containing protein n=1 Tax=Stereocaulon virgatum TaxID=373712 RepID=A0ABR4A3B8_9LECA
MERPPPYQPLADQQASYPPNHGLRLPIWPPSTSNNTNFSELLPLPNGVDAPRPQTESESGQQILPGGPEGEQMQEQLDGNTRARHANRPESRYKNVEVLLLQWEENDLGVEKEIQELELVFRERCNFTTHRWSIPSTDSEDKLFYRILQFRKGKTKDDLLILYYGGHAGGGPQECIWAATESPNSPELNWHVAQAPLLGAQAHLLLILDCCYAALAARNAGIGDNWCLAASTKESVAKGVSRSSFTSAVTREIDRCADKYWDKREPFDVQSIHHALIVWERDLEYTPILIRLTDHQCDATELTPLICPSERPRVVTTNSYPPDNTPPHIMSPPLRPKRSFTLPPKTMNGGTLSPGSSGTLGVQHSSIVQPQNKTQTLKLAGLPQSTDNFDIIHWFEVKLNKGSVISKIGPLIASSSERETKETTVTFSSTDYARRAALIADNDFRARARNHNRQITIDDQFLGLTCTYISKKSPDRQTNVDVVLVHGAYGHAINSFDCHYADPTSEFMWPCEALVHSLEAAGIYPRVMTFGWLADSWLHPEQSISHYCDQLLQALRTRRPISERPLFFIGHGVGGLLVKEVSSEIINFGFGIPHFKNPVRACFFFGVPNQAGDEENGFSTILANMRSALKDGNPPDPTLLHALSPRHTAISSISIEFEAIRKEYDITCITMNGKHETAGCLIVPPHQSTLDEDSDKAFHFELDYRDVVRPPRDEDNLDVVLDVMCETMCDKMNLQYSPTSRPRSRAKSEPTPRRQLAPNPELQAKQKEKVYARLRKYDTVFLVDDSGSMYGKRWDMTKEVVAAIARIAVKYDNDGVDVRFFNAYFKKEERLGLDSSQKVMDLFNKVEVDGETPTAEILDQELNEYIHDYKDNRHKKGLNLIVLTDGEPDDVQKVEDVIVKYARKLAELDAPTLQVGIQFVQIGGDKKAARFLKSLDDDLVTKFHLDRDMVDTVPWVPGQASHLYEKILLGGILKRIDDAD